MWRNSLPPLQQEILVFLAEKGASTKHEISKALKKAYKNVVFAFNSLKEKQLIEIIGTKKYREQEFELFWLALKGVVEAYSLGASISKLKTYTINYIFPKIKEEQLIHINAFFDFLNALPKTKAKKLLDMVQFDSNGTPKITSVDFNFVSPEEARKLFKILMKYEPYRTALKRTLQNLNDLMKEL